MPCASAGQTTAVNVKSQRRYAVPRHVKRPDMFADTWTHPGCAAMRAMALRSSRRCASCQLCLPLPERQAAQDDACLHGVGECHSMLV